MVSFPDTFVCGVVERQTRKWRPGRESNRSRWLVCSKQVPGEPNSPFAEFWGPEKGWGKTNDEGFGEGCMRTTEGRSIACSDASGLTGVVCRQPPGPEEGAEHARDAGKGGDAAMRAL